MTFNPFKLIFAMVADWFKTPVEFIDPVLFFRLLGVAFGPPGIRHFSELSEAEQQAMLAKAPILAKNHDDWPEPFKRISRSCTAWTMPERWPIIDGTSPDQPVPPRGTWLVKKGYLAMTTGDGWHLRLGFRPDDVDGYVTFPSVAFKKVG